MLIPDDRLSTTCFNIDVSGDGHLENGCLPNGTRYIHGQEQCSVTLKASVKEKYRSQYEVYAWEHLAGPDSADPKFCYGDTITIPIGGFAQPLLKRTDIPSIGTTGVTLRSSSEGGQVLGSEAIRWSGAYTGTLIIPPTSIMCLDAIPDAGFEFVDWQNPPLSGRGAHLVDVDPQLVPTPVAIFRQQIEHTLEVSAEAKNGSNGDPKCVGYVTVNPARAYYAPGTLVALIPNAQPGYLFSGWKGRGQDCSSDQALDHLPPSTDSSILLSMSTSRSVKAIFERAEGLIIDGGGVDTCPGLAVASDALYTKHHPSYYLAQPNKSALECYIPHCKFFIFNGHANSPAGDAIQCSEDPVSWLFYDEVPTPLYSYKLVYLNACNTAGNDRGAKWKTAFAADCFVGWEGDVLDDLADDFETRFFDRLRAGDSAQEANTQLLLILGGRMRAQGTYSVCEGDTSL
jgi:hypothetical protein